MAEPTLRREGNLRFAALPCDGYPSDPEALADQVRAALAAQTGQGVACHGPATLLFTMPPDDHPRAWECQVGLAVTGLPQPVGRMLIEDYAGLQALIVVHGGAIAELGATHRRLVEHARGLGHATRPYWRLALWRRRLADGNLLPAAEVSVFLDRAMPAT